MRIPLYITIVTIVLLVSSKCCGQDYQNGLGLRAGTNFTVSYKTFVSPTHAIEGIAGITRTGGQSQLTVGAFYQLHNTVTSDIPQLKWYYGAGAFVALAKGNVEANIALAGITGLEYVLEETPVALFIDATPYINLNNNSTLNIEASIGGRILF